MGILKQLIYTSTMGGFLTWGKSTNFPDALAGNSLLSPLYEFYECPMDAVAVYMNDQSIDQDTLFPVRRKYSRVGDKYMLMRTNYLGKEMTSTRFGNKFMHIFAADSGIKNPLVYFSHEGLFRNALAEEEKGLKESPAPLADISDDDFTVDGVLDTLCEYVNGNSHALDALASLFRRVYETINTENAHLIVFNAGVGKELWSLIECVLCLLPTEDAVKFTFDTHFGYSRSVDCLRIRDKLLAYYGALPQEFKSYSDYGHTYNMIDFNLLGADDEAATEWKNAIAKVFALGPFGLKAYSELISCVEGNGLERIKKAIVLVADVCAKFAELPISQVCTVYKAVMTGVVTDDVRESVNDLVVAACRNGIEKLVFIIDSLWGYERIMSILAEAAGRSVADDGFIKTVVDALWSGDPDGSVQSAIEKLKSVLPDYEKLETAIAAGILALVDEHEYELCGQLLSGDVGDRYDIICKYSSAGKRVEKAVAKLYDANESKLVKSFLAGNVEKTLAEVKRYVKCGNIDEARFYAAACDDFLSDASLKALFGGNKDSIAAAVVLGRNEECRKKLAHAVRAYIVKNCNTKNEPEAMLVSLEKSGVEFLADRGAFFRTLCNDKMIIADDNRANVAVLRKFAVEYVESLPENKRFAATYESRLQADSAYGARLSALHETLFGYALDIRKPDGVEALKALSEKYVHIPIDKRLLAVSCRYADNEILKALLADMPHEAYAEMYTEFAEKDPALAELYVREFLSKTVTDSMLISLLSEQLDKNVSQKLVESLCKELFTCICGNGTRPAKSVYTSLVRFFKRDGAELETQNHLDSAKDKYLISFAKKYGKSVFLPAFTRKLDAFGGKVYDDFVKAAAETDAKSKFVPQNDGKDEDRLLACWEFAERDNKSRIKEFAAYVQMGVIPSTKVLKRLLLRLDLCALSQSDALMLIAVMPKSDDCTWLTDVLKFVATAFSGKKVEPISRSDGSKTKDWVYNLFAWVLAKSSIDGKVSEDNAIVIHNVFGDEYCRAFAELMTADSELRGKLKGLVRLYPTIHNLSPGYADRLQNSIKYMDLNVKFRKKTDRIFGVDNK